MLFLCPSVVPLREHRDVPSPTVFATDENFLRTLTAEQRGELAACAIELTEQAWDRHCRDVAPGLAAGDLDAMDRIAHGPRDHQAHREDIGYASFGHATTALPRTTLAQPFRKPSLWVMGRQDSTVGWRDQLALMDDYPRATVAVLDRSGHNAQAERPDLFAALVRDWLDRIALEE